MAYCSNCGKELHENAAVCTSCGCEVRTRVFNNKDRRNFYCFLLTFLLGFIGSYIINHTSLKPAGWKSRTKAYFWLGIITCGIYDLVASVKNFVFDETKASNTGYYKD